MRLGVIGLGHVWTHQSSALELIEEIEIVSVCDVDETKKNVVTSKEISFYKSYETMVAKEKLDAVLVSTPPITHYEIVKYIVSKGVNVLVEKPITLDIDEMNDIYSLSRGNALIITAYHAAFAEDIRYFKANMLDNAIKEYGEIVSIESLFYDPYVVNSRIVAKAIPLAGSWIDSGVNALSVIGEIINLDRIETIKIVRNYDELGKMDIYAIGTYVFRGKDSVSNFYGYIKTDWTTGKNHKSTTITFRNSTKVLLNHSEQAIYIINQEDTEKVFVSEKLERLKQHYYNLFNDFIERVLSNADNEQFTKKIHNILLTKKTAYI